MPTSSRRSQQGLSLIELGLSMSVLLVVILGVWILYRHADRDAMVSKEAARLGDAASAIRRSFGPLGSYRGINAQVLAGKSYVAGWDHGAEGLWHAWGGRVEVFPAMSEDGVANASFRIVYEGVPADACVALVLAGYKDFRDVMVDGGSVLHPGSHGLQVDEENAASRCNNGTSSAHRVAFIDKDLVGMGSP